MVMNTGVCVCVCVCVCLHALYSLQKAKAEWKKKWLEAI